ncbi:hypothetical protein ACLOJK_005870 [Asimina triloba]
MPRVDLETLFRGSSCSGDSRIVCETTLVSADQRPQKPDLPPLDPHLPAESFRLPVEDEIDWVDRNAIFERKESTKGNSKWANWNPISSYKSQSQRITSNLKSNSKPSIIIGLPKRHDNTQSSRRSCRPAGIRDLVRSSVTGPVTEPASPKVSCIGRVRPKDKAKASRRRGSAENSVPAGKAAKGKLGFWAKIVSAFRVRRRRRSAGSEESSMKESSRAIEDGARKFPATEATDAPAPSLGELKKFASVRRSASWGADAEVGSDVRPPAEAKESTKRQFWSRRRRAGPRPIIACRRDLGDVGPATA